MDESGIDEGRISIALSNIQDRLKKLEDRLGETETLMAFDEFFWNQPEGNALQVQQVTIKRSDKDAGAYFVIMSATEGNEWLVNFRQAYTLKEILLGIAAANRMGLVSWQQDKYRNR